NCHWTPEAPLTVRYTAHPSWLRAHRGAKFNAWAKSETVDEVSKRRSLHDDQRATRTDELRSEPLRAPERVQWRVEDCNRLVVRSGLSVAHSSLPVTGLRRTSIGAQLNATTGKPRFRGAAQPARARWSTPRLSS